MQAKGFERTDPLRDLWHRYVEWMRDTASTGFTDERARLDRMLDRATAPAECGPEIPVSPARGPMATFVPYELRPKAGVAVPVSDDDYEPMHSGWHGRTGVRRADVWDQMAHQSARRGGAGAQVFTAGQVQMARFYRDLTERHMAGGVRCSSLEAMGGGGGTGGEFIDAFVREGRELDRLHERIGRGIAMQVRRVRPSARGGAGAAIISDRVLVDMVCIGDLPVASVLQRHGWSNDGKNAAKLREALKAALDRMRGSEGRSGQILSATF